MSTVEISRDDYHADRVGSVPTLSASLANILISKSPAHAWASHPRLNPNYQREVEDKFDVGTVAHSLLLEGIEKARPLDFKDWRTDAAKAERDACRDSGLIPLLRPQYDRVRAMVEAVNRQLDEFDVSPRPFTDGSPEVALSWETEGVQCRALVDWLRSDGSYVDDFKTTSASASPLSWGKTALGMGCDVQVVFHSLGVEAVYGVVPAWRYVVAETYPPYAISVLEPSPTMVALGTDKVRAALKLWRDCLKTDRWSAYLPREVARIEPPAWALTQWLEHPEAGELSC